LFWFLFVLQCFVGRPNAHRHVHGDWKRFVLAFTVFPPFQVLSLSVLRYVRGAGMDGGSPCVQNFFVTVPVSLQCTSLYCKPRAQIANLAVASLTHVFIVYTSV
jgi:hypothetical protein